MKLPPRDVMMGRKCLVEEVRDINLHKGLGFIEEVLEQSG
jgi:hypothetical protein